MQTDPHCHSPHCSNSSVILRMKLLIETASRTLPNLNRYLSVMLTISNWIPSNCSISADSHVDERIPIYS